MIEQLAQAQGDPAAQPIRMLLGLGSLGGQEHILSALNERADVSIDRRCVDVVDLLASAQMLDAEAAVVNDSLRRWHEGAIAEVRSRGIVVVALVAHEREVAPFLAMGADSVVVVGSASPEESARDIVEVVAPRIRRTINDGHEDDAPSEKPSSGHLVAVWGPGGAPGRTATAIGLADEAARAGLRTALVDADSDAACVGAWLAMDSEVSGLSAMVRLAEQGMLTPESMAAAARSIDSGLRVITGIPSRQRWRDIRPERVAAVLDLARRTHQLTVVDLAAWSGGDWPPNSDPRHHGRGSISMTCLNQANSLVLVGSADPLGLMRLSMMREEIPEEVRGIPVRVVLTRARPGVLGARPDVAANELLPWAESPILIADDPASFDACLRAGRTLGERSPRAKAREAHAGLIRSLAIGAGR